MSLKRQVARAYRRGKHSVNADQMGFALLTSAKGCA